MGDGSEDNVAIRLEEAFKHYGSGKHKTPVLLGLDMCVRRGQIYGLLGELSVPSSLMMTSVAKA